MTGHVTDHVTVHATGHVTGHVTDHVTDHVTVHATGHVTDHVNVLWPYTLPLQGFTPPMLVFVQSIERAKELFHELIYDGLNVDVIHSERTQAQRDNVVKCFRTGKVCVPAPPLQPQIEPYSE